jgi:hypothetical protein
MNQEIIEFSHLTPDNPLLRHLNDKRLEWSGLTLSSLVDPNASAEIDCAPFERDESGQWRTSRWIGSFSVDGRCYHIVPRIGNARFAHIATSALSAMVVSGAASIGQIRSDTLLDLLPLAWYVAFRSGRQRNGLTRAYVRRDELDCTELRGSLDLGRQLVENDTKRHQLACSWDDLTVDNPINQGTRLVINHLRRNKRFPYSWHRTDASAELDGWHERLSLLGVTHPSSYPTERVRWSRGNDGFRPAHRLGRHVIQDQGITTVGASTARSLFVDSAEIWELYLRQRLDEVVKREFPGFKTVWPRSNAHKDALLEWEGKKAHFLIPDFQIVEERNSKAVMVLDAKYRWFKPLDTDFEVAAQMARYVSIASQGSRSTAPSVLLYPRVLPDGFNAKNSSNPFGSGKFLMGEYPRIEAWGVDLPDVQEAGSGFNKKVEAQLKLILDRFIGITWH